MQPGWKRDVPVQLAQDSARHNDHDWVRDALDVLAKLLDDATVVDEYVRIDYDVEERLVFGRKRILQSTVVRSRRDADVLPAGKLVWRTCISTSLAALYSCSTVLSYGATAMVVHNSSEHLQMSMTKRGPRGQTHMYTRVNATVWVRYPEC